MTENSTGSPEAPTGEAPLESWKEISAYLKRGVRTVKRWEKSEGLPVRRHLHQARASVYAYPSELDAWLATRQPGLDKAPLGMPWRSPVPALALTTVLLLALVSVGNGLGVAAAGAAAGEPGGSVVTRQVWSGPEIDEAAVTPDGSYLTFVDWSTGDVALRDLATGENRRLTNKGSWEDSIEYGEWPLPSPDGQQVAYAWFNGERYDLRIIDVAGSKPRILYTSESIDYIEPGAWSADGQYIVASVARVDTSWQILLIKVEDGAARLLKSTDWRHPHVEAVSPDGQYVVYDFPPEEDSPNRDIFLLALDGSREIRVVEHPANDRVVEWTPDGNGLLFTSDRTGKNALWVLPMTGGEADGPPQIVKSEVGAIFPLGLTRDGKLYYKATSGIRDAYIARFDPVTKKVVGEPKPVSQFYVGSNQLPVWSPDGKYLAYLSNRDLTPGPFSFRVLVIRNLESGEEKQLFPKLIFRPPWSPLSWSPDGRFLYAVGRDRKGRESLYRISTETGEVTPLVRTERNEGIVTPIVSSDGNAVFYVRKQLGDLRSIVRRSLANGEETMVYRAEKVFLDHISLSPDGRQLAFPITDFKERYEGIKVVPATGGEPRDVLRLPLGKQHTLSSWAGLAWTPDGRHLLFARWRNYPKDQTLDFYSVSIEGGEMQKLGLAAERPIAVKMHPDGRRIAFTSGDPKPGIWVLENFLPELETTAAK